MLCSASMNMQHLPNIKSKELSAKCKVHAIKVSLRRVIAKQMIIVLTI